MLTGELGKVFEDGEFIIRQGELGDCMYVIQEGEVEVLFEKNGEVVSLAVMGEGDFFGEMALFDLKNRAASVRALGQVRVLTVDKKTLLRNIQQDPSLALRLLEKLSVRLRLQHETDFKKAEQAWSAASQLKDPTCVALCTLCPLQVGYPVNDIFQTTSSSLQASNPQER